MNELRSRKLLLLILSSACCVWATPSACNPNPPGTTVTYNLGGGSNGLASGGTAAAGCEQINNEFTGFTYSGANPAGGSASVQFTGASESVIDANFTGSFSATAAVGVADIFTFVATLDPSDVPAPGEQWMITGLNLALSGENLGGNPSAQVNVFVNFCVDAATCSFSSNHNPGFGQLFHRVGSPADTTTACYNGSGTTCVSSGSPTSVSLGTGGTSIAFQVEIEFVNSSAIPASISGLDLTFDQTAETPEPATFALMGSALALLALANRRRSKV